jgi:hypothetical protein
MQTIAAIFAAVIHFFAIKSSQNLDGVSTVCFHMWSILCVVPQTFLIDFFV